MYDAILLVSFGGPEKAEDVIPFLENVTRGRNVPPQRLAEVAGHYYHFGGKSPINDQCRELIAALGAEMDRRGLHLPLYWGNRNWRPFLAEAVGRMRADGVKHALAFVTSAFSSYSSCRQYRENIQAARAAVEGAPEIDKLRGFFNHPCFVEACVARVQDALACFSASERENLRLVATAHSVPSSMAQTSEYEAQLRETLRLVAAEVGATAADLVYQSRSGPPAQPWLGPDILDHLRALHAAGVRNVLVAPLGFLSDHLEVLYDLDFEAAAVAAELGIKMVRAKTVGTHPRFVSMICELIEERIAGAPKRALGNLGPSPDVCEQNCCPLPRITGRPPAWADPCASPRP
jgi:ferrochelatase